MGRSEGLKRDAEEPRGLGGVAQPRRRAFVTGHTGFTGTTLTRYLEELGYSWEGYSTAEGDVRDRRRVQRALDRTRPDVIFHLAAAGRSEPPSEQLSVAVNGTANLLDRAAETTPSARVLVISSSAVYGARRGGKPVDETSALRPTTPYGRSKLALEAEARRVARRRRMWMTIVRPFNLVGPGIPSSLAIGAFIEQIVQAERAERERVVRVGNIEAIRDFVDVRDAVRAFEVLSRRGRPLASYNVCSGMGVAIAQCLDDLLSLTEATVVERDPGRVTGGDLAIQVGDGARTAARTGWRPLITLHDSLRDALAHRRRLGP